MNRLLLRDYPGANDDLFTYDATGKKLTANNSDATLSFIYDAANRVKNETLNGKITGYDYDIVSRKRVLHYPNGRIITEQYDERNRLVNVIQATDTITTFVYDVANRNIGINYKNGTSTTITYDANNRVISIFSNPKEFQYFEYAYDNQGNKLFEKKNHQPTNSEQYKYDDDNQLIDFKEGTLTGNEIQSPSTQIQYNYDPTGNRKSINVNGNTTNYTVNNINQYISIIGTVSTNPKYDLNGNVIYDGSLNLIYDNENRLLNIDGGSVASYKYDAIGRRIETILPYQTINYYYAGQNLIFETETKNVRTTSFIYGEGLDYILNAQHNDTDYFYHTNALSSISTITNAFAATVERYEYDAFGKPNIYDSLNNLLSVSSVLTN